MPYVRTKADAEILTAEVRKTCGSGVQFNIRDVDGGLDVRVVHSTIDWAFREFADAAMLWYVAGMYAERDRAERKDDNG